MELHDHVAVSEPEQEVGKDLFGVGLGFGEETVVQGTLDLLILKILALEPMNGWSLGERLRQVSDEVLQVSDGSLYPALHKLEQQGWITAEWKQTENNRRAKFYSLTRPGRRQLDKETANWTRLSGAIWQVVKLKET